MSSPSQPDPDIQRIFAELACEIDVNHKMLEHQQRGFEQSIGNLAALKLLKDDDVDKAVKNS